MDKDLAQAIDNSKSIPAAFFELAKQKPGSLLFSQASTGEKISYTRGWLAEKVAALAEILRTAGVVKGDRVAVLSNTRPEWLLVDLAVQSLGAITISIYQTLPAEDVGYILYDSDCKIIFVENQEQADKLLKIAQEDFTIPAVEDRAEHTARISLNSIFSFEEVSSSLSVEFLDVEKLKSDNWQKFSLEQIERSDLAAFVYTSGTTGPAKAVMQTHGNHLSNVRQVINCGLITGFPGIMLFLPLAHSFARLMAYLGILTPCVLHFPRISDRKTSKVDLNLVTVDIAQANAEIIPLVPRVLEKMQSGLQEVIKKPGIKNFLIRTAVNSAIRQYLANQKGSGTTLLDKIIFEGTAGLRAVIKKKLFGENFRYCVSGGAKLNPEVSRFFDALGIEVLEGYGLTETCVATNINPVGRKKIGTVGPVLDKDIELKISPEGEIWFRGPNITQGYFNRKQATAAAWNDEGWFLTGDLGSLDEEGYLAIIGRKKEIIVNSYGKNISCLNVEQQLCNSEFISQAVLIGDGKPYCVALIVPNFSALKAWSKQKGFSAEDLKINSSAVQELLATEIARVNQKLASFEEVKKYHLVEEEFTVENALLTPTMKIKRGVVEKKYASEIAGLYS